jgi:hypothetical protein
VLADVTIFVNGGYQSKSPAVLDFEKVVTAVGQTAPNFRYLDANHNQVEPAIRTHGSTYEFHRTAVDNCNNATECCNLCEKSWCCHITGIICPLHQARVFDDALDCEWHGRTIENGNHDGHLKPAKPPSFDRWLHMRWRINIHTFEHIQWAPYSIFAASRETLLKYDNTSYYAQLLESERAGLNGGMVAHFYERAWRTLFST